MSLRFGVANMRISDQISVSDPAFNYEFYIITEIIKAKFRSCTVNRKAVMGCRNSSLINPKFHASYLYIDKPCVNTDHIILEKINVNNSRISCFDRDICCVHVNSFR